MDTPPEPQKGERRNLLPHLDAWCLARLDLLAVLVLVIGLILRLVKAANGYLNPDEALQYLIAHQANLAATYQASLTNAHPPLLFFALHFWRLLGDSEFMLRLFSVLAGTAFLWVSYRWVSLAVNRVAAFAALLMLTFSPALVSLSAEVRAYALLLVFMAGALYYLEQGFQQPRPGSLIWSGIFTALALLTQYSAIWFALALGIYGLIRLLRRELKGGQLARWCGVQAILIGICLFLYVTHISKLRGGGAEKDAASGWLSASYFHPGAGNPLLFLLRAFYSTFGYLFATKAAGILGLLLMLIAVVLLFRNRTEPIRSSAQPFAWLIILPFVITASAALVGAHPFGGTRHVIFLLPFAAAGVGFLVARLCRCATAGASGARVWPLLVGALIVLPVWRLTAAPLPQAIYPPNQRRSLMNEAMGYLREQVAPNQVVFTDFQSCVLLGYYLGRHDITPFPHHYPDLAEFSFSGYRVISAIPWYLDAQTFADEFDHLKRVYHLKPTDRVWVFQAGWGDRLTKTMNEPYPDAVMYNTKTFGNDLAVFQVPVRMSLTETGRAEWRQTVRQSLLGLARAVKSQRPPGAPQPEWRFLFWPDDTLFPPEPRLLDSLAGLTLSYRDLYRTVTRPEQFDDFLPALGFWLFGTRERHVSPLHYMDEGENFVADDYRFTLLATDPDSLTAAYDIQK
jgi:hypothetical protein